MTRGAEGKVGKVFVGDMAEDKAVQLASTVVSEGAVYSVRIFFIYCGNKQLGTVLHGINMLFATISTAPADSIRSLDTRNQ